MDLLRDRIAEIIGARLVILVDPEFLYRFLSNDPGFTSGGFGTGIFDGHEVCAVYMTDHTFRVLIDAESIQ